jgi:cytochrome b
MKTVKVWDIFIRFFHWSLVLSIIAQLVTAEANTGVHVIIGYFIVFLLLARIFWGFVGSKHARFVDFIYPPKEVFSYLSDLIKRKPTHYLGHNPAGGAMVVALLLVLSFTVFAGLKTLGIRGKGPLAHLDVHMVGTVCADEDEVDHQGRFSGDAHHEHDGTGPHQGFWKETHEVSVGVLLALAAIHVAGVLVSSYVHKENLILAMITGVKKTL